MCESNEAGRDDLLRIPWLALRRVGGNLLAYLKVIVESVGREVSAATRARHDARGQEVWVFVEGVEPQLRTSMRGGEWGERSSILTQHHWARRLLGAARIVGVVIGVLLFQQRRLGLGLGSFRFCSTLDVHALEPAKPLLRTIEHAARFRVGRAPTRLHVLVDAILGESTAANVARTEGEVAARHHFR